MKVKLIKDKKYSFCSCGLSDKLPFCDNAHRKFNFDNDTNYKSVKIISKIDTIIDVDSSTWVSCDKGS